MKITLQRINVPGYDFPLYAEMSTDAFDGEFVDIEYKPHGTRTSQQNKAMHQFFNLLAKALNDAGYDQKRTLRADMDIPWSPDAIKALLWRPVQQALFDKKSTTKLSTTEVSQIYDVVMREIAKRTGVVVEFPSRFTEGR